MHIETVNPVAWFLVGPTAVGKSAVAQFLAERTGAAILSADAMLVYRGMDIGTAKPLPAERGQVPYFGIDLVDPDQPFSSGAWLTRVRAQLAEARWQGRPAATAAGALLAPAAGDLIVAGGTGLYVRALIQGLEASASDPARRNYWQERLEREGLVSLQRELAARAPQGLASLDDPGNPRRVIRALEHLEAHGALPHTWQDAPRPRVVGLQLPRADLHARIARRVARMFATGLIDEVAALRTRYSESWGMGDSHTSRGVRMPLDKVATAPLAIGYEEVCALLDKRISREQAIEQIVIRTRQLAKRQETWFRHQAEVAWVGIAADEPVEAIAARVLAAWSEHGPTPIRLS